MLRVELPNPLQEEFERAAQLLHEENGIQHALIEAIELWLAQQHQKSIDVERTINNQLFDKMRLELEEKYPGQWIVIAMGKFWGAADTPERLNRLAADAKQRLVVKLEAAQPKQVELGWQMNFA